MKESEVKKLINYWEKISAHDYETMMGLLKIKRYSDALFYGHIVLEKILKAHVAKNTKKDAPRSHNLLQLWEATGLDLDKNTKEFLATVNRFNMRTRYPDIKFSFYKLCTPIYTRKNINKIKKIYNNLCQKLTLKK